jgi:hypothetical protein
MPSAQPPLAPAEKQRRYRVAQRRRGIPTGTQVAMAALRQIVLKFHREGREDGIVWLADRIERDLKASPTGRHLTRFGIHSRIDTLFDQIIKDDKLWR